MRSLALVGLALGSCTVDRSRTADPAQVPTASALHCTDGGVVVWRDGAWTCAAPTDVEREGGLTRAGFGQCATGQIATGVDAAGHVLCATDVEPDAGPPAWSDVTGLTAATDWPGTVPWTRVTGKPAGASGAPFAGPTCASTDKVVGIDVSTGTVNCAPDIDADTLASLSCSAGGEVATWNGTAWTCAPLPVDTDRDTLDALGCTDGQIAKRTGGAWACASDAVGVTRIEAGAGIALTPSPITATGTVAVDFTAVAHASAEAEVTGARGAFASLAARLDDLASRVATIEAALCPPGFTSSTEGTYVVCTRTVTFGGFSVPDVMVKVGDFWIDRYEMKDCPAVGAFGAETGDDTTAVACSYPGVAPLASITWFQAAQMCANAGKRLCDNAEWQTAASGTPDPGSDGGATGCNVNSDRGLGAYEGTSGAPANTGAHTACVSRFGANDMIGNVWEWVADWQGKDNATGGLTTNATYGSDYMSDVSPAANQGGDSNFPAAALRGGGWDDGTYAGAFALSLLFAPSYPNTAIGARCCAGGR